MKTVSTQYTDNAELDFLTLLALLKNLAEEEFIVLVADDDKNYIQVTLENEAEPNSGFLVEMRLYDDDNFIHYRKIIDNFDHVIKDFDAFYHDAKSYDYHLENWQDITEEFKHTLTLDTRLSGEDFEGYIATIEAVMDSIEALAESDDYVHIFGDNGEKTTVELLIRPDFAMPEQSYHARFINADGETYVHASDSMQDIEKIVSDFLHEQIIDIDGWQKQ